MMWPGVHLKCFQSIRLRGVVLRKTGRSIDNVQIRTTTKIHDVNVRSLVESNVFRADRYSKS